MYTLIYIYTYITGLLNSYPLSTFLEKKFSKTADFTGLGGKLNEKVLQFFFPGCLFLPRYLSKNTWYHSFFQKIFLFLYFELKKLQYLMIVSCYWIKFQKQINSVAFMFIFTTFLPFIKRR